MGALPPPVWLSPVESESEGGRGGSMVEDAEGRVRRRGRERLSCVSRHGKGVPLALGDACAWLGLALVVRHLTRRRRSDVR